MPLRFPWSSAHGSSSEDEAGGSTEAPPDAESEPRTSPASVADVPIGDLDQDRLGRRPFVERLAHFLGTRTDPASFVVGLYGPWGHGKTSILRLVKQELEDKYSEHLSVIEFNPWFYDKEDAIAADFLRDIADALNQPLERDREEVARRFERTARIVEPIAGLNFLTKAIVGSIISVAGALGNVSLRELRERLRLIVEAEAERETPRRVIVLMDDIDRLPPEQIAITFRIVKLAADLDYVSYVLAFDEKIVAQVLGKEYEGNSEGVRFLEKIVQLPLHVPRIDESLLKGIMLTDLYQLLDGLGVQPAAEDSYRLQVALERYVWPQVQTIRAGKLLLSALEFAIPALPAEVNIADVVLIEALRVFSGSAYKFVSAHKEIFLEGVNRSDDDLRAEVNSFGSKVLGLLKEMFPRFDPETRGPQSSQEVLRWSQEKRICAPGYFNRYFMYGLPIGDILDSDVDTAASTTDPDVGTQLLTALIENNDPGLVVQKLLERADQLPADQAEALARSISNITDQLEGHDSLQSPDSPASRAAFTIVTLLRRIPRPDRQMLALSLMHQSRMDFRTILFGWLEIATRQPGQQEPLLSESELQELGQSFAEEVAEADERESVLIPLPQMALFLYRVWREYGDAEALNARVAAAMRDDPRLVARYLALSITVLEHEQVINSISAKGYQLAAALLPPELLAEVISDVFPELHQDSSKTEFIREQSSKTVRETLPMDEILILTFLAFYRQEAAALPPVPPTVYELSPSRRSPLMQRGPTQPTDTERPTDLLCRIAVLTPHTPAAFLTSAGAPSSRVTAEERDDTLKEVLGEADVTAWARDNQALWGGSSSPTWRLEGYNEHAISTLRIDASEWDAGARPAARIEFKAQTYSDQSGRGAAASDALYAVLDVELRLASESALMGLEELWTLLYAQLSLLDISRQATARLLSPGEYSDGELAIWLVSGRNDFPSVIELGEPSIVGGGLRREFPVFSTLPLDETGIIGSPANRSNFARSQMVAHVLNEVFKAGNRRGYVQQLSQVLQVCEATVRA